MANEKREKAQEARDEKLTTALKLIIAQAGGDYDKTTENQQQAFFDELGAWVLTTDIGE